MAEINSYGQFMGEIAIPLWYTAAATTVFGPPGLALTRHFVMKAGLPSYFRAKRPDKIWNHFMQYVFRWGGPLPKKGSRKTPSPHPVSMRGVHRLAKQLAEYRVPKAERMTSQARLAAAANFRNSAKAWVYQASPCAVIVGGVIGLLTPLIAGDSNYLREERFDWPARTMMYAACTLSGSLSTWVGHNFMSAPLAKWFVVRMGGTNFGYIFPYLVLPVFARAAMFFFNQVIYNVDFLASNAVGGTLTRPDSRGP